MSDQTISVGFIGAGYIARWHAQALRRIPGARLAAVCDPDLGAAQALAAGAGARAFADLDSMLAQARCDAVHVLTPPPLHRDIALACLAAGCHVLLEKPFALSGAEAREIVAAAEAAGRVVAVNHNFLGLPAYERLKAALADGRIGRVSHADISWRYPLPPLRSGPFGGWMLRRPENLMFELGPHLFSLALDLFGPLSEPVLRVAHPITLPGGARHFQSWTLLARAGATELRLSVSLLEGADDRSVRLHAVNATARLDLAADTLVIDRPNASDIVLNPLRQRAAEAGQLVGQGLRNAVREIASLNRRTPYEAGFAGVFRAFYGSVRGGGPVDPRFSGTAAIAVTEAVAEAAALLPPAPERSPAPIEPGPVAGTALVFGGTGFLGRELVRGLLRRGWAVRVVSRGSFDPFADLDHGGAVTMVRADSGDPAALREAMEGVDVVYHLARAEERDWAGYLRNDVEVTQRIGEAALAAGVGRLVYTGTIASYDASEPAQVITEATPFGPLERRNLYARAKAEGEARLLALHRDRGLPVVIARPGIVIGPGGPLQHWGIGRWHGSGAVRLWGNGRNPLPFVLNEDVADGLIALALVPGIEGQSFNLVGDPLMSARDYFASLRETTGVQVRTATASLRGLYLADLGKYVLKRRLMGRDVARPLLSDWRSRAHLSRFSNARAREVLGWQPVSERAEFTRRAFAPGPLFGF